MSVTIPRQLRRKEVGKRQWAPREYKGNGLAEGMLGDDVGHVRDA